MVDMLLVLRISAAFGLLISLYFTAIYNGWIESIERLVPSTICSNSHCTALLRTPFAHLFGPPNFYVGAGYFLLLLVMTVVMVPPLVWKVLAVVSWIVVCLALYLAYSLIFTLKTRCILCFAAQSLTIVVAICLTLLAF